MLLSRLLYCSETQLFIILGVITIPIAIFGFLSFPDLPETTQAKWLNAEERHFAISRLPQRVKDAKGHQLGWSLIRRVLLSPIL